MLLAPYRQPSFLIVHLSPEYALHALVERLHTTLAQGFVGQSLIRSLLLSHSTQQVHRVHHRIVVVGDVHLIAMHLRPELGPATVFVLSAQQVLYRFQHTLLVAFHLRSLIELCQIEHLHIRSTVVGGRVVTPFLVAQHLYPFLVSQGTRHIDVLGPSACHTLIEQHLVAYTLGLFRLVELVILVVRQVSASPSALRLSRHDYNRQHKQKCQ